MFDNNQSIMLLGAAGNTDVSVHLTNAPSQSNSAPIDSAENDVITT